MQKGLKNYAFIDSQNLNLAIKECGWDLDFAKFCIYLKDKYKVAKTLSPEVFCIIEEFS